MSMSLGGSGTGDAERKEINKYLQEHFGESLDAFLYPPDEHQRLHGRWLKIIRETRLPEERKKKHHHHTRPRRRSAELVSAQQQQQLPASPAPQQDQRSKCLSQSSLAVKASRTWEILYGEPYTFDDRLIRKIEAGEQTLTKQLVTCLAVSLRADRKELAILFEAAGYHGWDWYKTQLTWSGGSILTYIEEGAENYDYEKFVPAEILHVIKLRMDAEISDSVDE